MEEERERQRRLAEQQGAAAPATPATSATAPAAGTSLRDRNINQGVELL